MGISLLRYDGRKNEMNSNCLKSPKDTCGGKRYVLCFVLSGDGDAFGSLMTAWITFIVGNMRQAPTQSRSHPTTAIRSVEHVQ